MVSSNGLVEESKSDAKSPLDEGERARLKELEAIVEQGLQTFYEVGKALMEIQEKKLYRETHKTFAIYCRNRWGMGKSTAYRYISAAQVMENLSPIGDIFPKKESQVRPLTQLPSAQQLEIWQQAVDLSLTGIPTAAEIQRLVDKKISSGKAKEDTKVGLSELEQLRLENKSLKEHIKQKDLDRERRAAEVATELEHLRAENRQLRAELRQWERDWEVRIAQERDQIRQELRAEIREELKVEIREEVKAEYEGQINTLTAQVTYLTQQLTDMTAKYEGVLARLEAIERGNK